MVTTMRPAIPVVVRAACAPLERDRRARVGRPQQQHVVAVDHRRVGGGAVRLPHRPAIEGREAARAARHIRKAVHPDEVVGPVEVVELTHHRHARGFERGDECVLEEIDQHVALARMQRVAPQFDDVAAVGGLGAGASGGDGFHAGSPCAVRRHGAG
jgi:hypothetical protein